MKREPMTVSIEFFGIQRSITETDRITLSISDDTKVHNVLEYVRQRYPGLPLEEGSILVTVNQHVASLDRHLKQNDAVAFVPCIGGG